MSKELTIQKPSSALAVMASRFNVEPAKLLSTLKSTVFKGASDDELLALVVVANEYGLNPLTKEIYAFPAKGGGIVPVISIDGWINRMNNNAAFDGIEFAEVFDKDKKPVCVTASIYRKDRSRPIKVTEYYAECRRNTEPWNTMPARMLRHKALCQCVRVAFGFGGVYDEDEAHDLMIRDVTPVVTSGPNLAGLPKAADAAAPATEPAPVQGNKSPVTPNGAQGDPAPVSAPAVMGVSTESAAHETKGEPETLTLDASPLTARDILRDAMVADHVTLTDLRAVTATAKLGKPDFSRVVEIPDDLVQTLLDNWQDVLTHCGKGGE